MSDRKGAKMIGKGKIEETETEVNFSKGGLFILCETEIGAKVHLLKKNDDGTTEVIDSHFAVEIYKKNGDGIDLDENTDRVGIAQMQIPKNELEQLEAGKYYVRAVTANQVTDTYGYGEINADGQPVQNENNKDLGIVITEENKTFAQNKVGWMKVAG